MIRPKKRSTWLSQDPEERVEARMPFQPRLDLGMLVRSEVVGDQMDVEEWWRLSVDAAQELEPLRVTVRRLTLADRPYDRHHTGAVSRQQHDPSPQNQPLRRIPRRNPAFQQRSIRRRQQNARTGLFIPADSHEIKPMGILC
jgi:hypothetical protein